MVVVVAAVVADLLKVVVKGSGSSLMEFANGLNLSMFYFLSLVLVLRLEVANYCYFFVVVDFLLIC